MSINFTHGFEGIYIYSSQSELVIECHNFYFFTTINSRKLKDRYPTVCNGVHPTRSNFIMRHGVSRSTLIGHSTIVLPKTHTEILHSHTELFELNCTYTLDCMQCIQYIFVCGYCDCNLFWFMFAIWVMASFKTINISNVSIDCFCQGFRVDVLCVHWVCWYTLAIELTFVVSGPGYYKWTTVYPKKYAHGFVVLCFVVVMQSFIMNSHEVFIHIHQGCFAGTGAIVRLPQCQWSKPDGYGKISQCITTTKHSKAKTVCIFLGIYCTSASCVANHVFNIYDKWVFGIHGKGFR